ncbi:MAG: hypothetical protein IT531_11985 [Burkholderiales bacterium]|nr:hypothetical protein [Burkholderiales bacterium]
MRDHSGSSTRRRQSWLDGFSRYSTAPGVGSEDARRRLAHLDDLLYDYWRLGEQVIALWSSSASILRLLAFPHFALAEYVGGIRPIAGETDPARFVDQLVSGPKHAAAERFDAIARKLGIEPVGLTLAFDPVSGLGPELIDALVRRYSVSLFRNRAVVLLDMVGFSTFAPIEQTTLLNSLSYSINSAYDQLAGREARIQFARSPTGDGFYLWNRAPDALGNVELYKLMLLLLADNAIVRAEARTRAVPELRAAFHVGEHYEFYQPEGLSPSLSSYLVGQVTIDLARMLEQAMAGQILIGDFPGTPSDGATPGRAANAAPAFVERMQSEVLDFAGMRLAGEVVREIRCYLTGPRRAEGGYGISRYGTCDKHGTLRHMFNAKINIHRQDAQPIYLGIRDPDVRGFRVEPLRA